MGLSWRRLSRDTASVSPVIGTVLVLAITVLGIASILYWGAPTIDRIQSKNAQVAMEGSFEGLRDASQELSVPDHSRFPTISLPSGTLSIQAGTRFLLAADTDPTQPNCDFHVTDWSDAGADKDKVVISTSSAPCRIPSQTAGTAACPASGTSGNCLEVYRVSGSTLTRMTVAAISGGKYAVSDPSTGAVDFSSTSYDWLFRLTDNAGTPTVYAQAWLHSSAQVAWTLKSATGTWEEYLEGGAIFSRTGGTFFIDKSAPFGDTSFGPGYFGFWLRTLRAGSYSSIDGQGSHQVFLSLLENSVRVDSSQVYRLRFDFSGSLAQPWCNSLLARDPNLSNGATPPLFTAVYREGSGFTCATGGAIGTNDAGVRSVCYIHFTAVTPAPGNACSTAGTAFKFRFLHARIQTSLAI